MGVLDRFATRGAFGVLLKIFAIEVITITRMQGSIACLNDGRIMVSARLVAGRVILQPPFPLPGLAFIIRDRHAQTVAATFGVVVNQDPVAIAKGEDLGAGSRVGQIAVGYWRPGLAVVSRFAFVQAFRSGAVIAHQRE